MNNLPLAPDLQPICDLLSGSLKARSGEVPPAIPADLMADLTRRFALPSTGSQVSVKPVSFFEKLRMQLATPAFGLAALAVIPLVGMALRPDVPSEPSSFRGGTGIETSTVMIVLLTTDPIYHQILKDSGQFDMSSVIETSDPMIAAQITNPKLLIDFTSLKMVGYDSESREVISGEVPKSTPELIDLIARSIAAFY